MSAMTRIDVFGCVRQERAYQDAKWGTIEAHPHTVAEWLLIMERELAEAKEAWVTKGGDREALREIVQVVAVGVACLEQHGAVRRGTEQERAVAAVNDEPATLEPPADVTEWREGNDSASEVPDPFKPGADGSGPAFFHGDGRSA